MPKLRNVTDADIQTLVNAVSDLSQTAADYARRMASGYVGEITDPARVAVLLNGAMHSLAELQAVVLDRVSLDADKRALEATLRTRLSQPGEAE